MSTGPDLRWLDQVESLAQDALPEAVFRYVVEGARDEITVREAVEAWRSIRVAPRVLQDVTRVDTAVTLLGRSYAAPLGIAPMTLQRAADPDGEVAMARAAAGAGVPLVLSSNAGSTFEQVRATGVDWWLQIYLTPDRADCEPLLRAAVEAGAAAVVLTVDTPVVATRHPHRSRTGAPAAVWSDVDPTWLGANHPSGLGRSPGERPKARDLGPDDVTWLARTTDLPVVIKGVLRADDARRCVAAGAAAVWVSNHGGRQLDRALATAHCVESVRAGVGGAAEVYVDGGVRSGLDVLLAVSLGADAAFVGRPMFHALASGGTAGVARALDELVSELEESMRLSGCATVGSAAGIACPDRRFSL